MKKSVLSIVAIAFAAVSVLSSCDKNDDGYGQAAKPQTTVQTNSSTNSTYYYNTVYFVGDEVASLGTFTATISDGSKSTEFNVVEQGKHGTYTISGKQLTGYLFTNAQPTTGGVKATLNYTPNDKAKSLTENDKVQVSLLSHRFTTDSAYTLDENSLIGNDMNGTQGNYVVETIQNTLKVMNR